MRHRFKAMPVALLAPDHTAEQQACAQKDNDGVTERGFRVQIQDATLCAHLIVQKLTAGLLKTRATAFHCRLPTHSGTRSIRYRGSQWHEVTTVTEIDRDVAVEFDKRVNLALRYLFTAATELKDRIDPEHFRVYAKALGHASSELDLGVLEPIYRAHPDLRPDHLPQTFTMPEFEQGD